KAQLQSQYQQLKGKYVVVKAIKDNSGFGWCPYTGRPTAPPSVWKEYITAHPRANEFQSKGLALFEELDAIFSGSIATGHYASSSLDVNAFHSETGDDSDVQGSESSDAPPFIAVNEVVNELDHNDPSNTVVRPSLQDDSVSPARHNKARSKRKSPTTGQRISSALEMLANSHERKIKQKFDTKAEKQVALADFMARFGGQWLLKTN
ncbi:TPA: hypothetical protein N0F65_006646, partial [Lagenidium giganteum]